MTQAQFVDMLARETGFTKANTAIFIEKLKSALTQQLEEGEAITLVNFGTFSVKERAARQGYNFKTKEQVKIPATRTVHFASSTTLKEAVGNRGSAKNDKGD